jgi:hypothetical protein
LALALVHQEQVNKGITFLKLEHLHDGALLLITFLQTPAGVLPLQLPGPDSLTLLGHITDINDDALILKVYL